LIVDNRVHFSILLK